MRFSHPKKRIAILLGLGAPAGAIWFAVNTQIPIDFIGPAPEARFLSKEDANRRPIINKAIPLIGSIVYPRPRYTVGYLTPDAYCGYLAWNSPPRWELAKFEVDGTSCLAVTDTMVEEDSYHAKESLTRITALPYATDLAYRDVTLVYGDQKCRLRLPVTRDHGPSMRRAQTLRAGPYTITFRPEPWRLTTAPFVVGISANAPPGVRLLLTVSWQMLPGNFQTVSEGGWLLEGSKTTYVSLPRDFGGIRTVG